MAKPFFVFVVMPFKDEVADVYDLGIKPACETAGAKCERADEQMFTENILSRIYGQINDADVIVSDVTERNANVLYETGYAHGLGKRVVFVTKKAEDIPFDLLHYPHIIYGNRIATRKPNLLKQFDGACRTQHLNLRRRVRMLLSCLAWRSTLLITCVERTLECSVFGGFEKT